MSQTLRDRPMREGGAFGPRAQAQAGQTSEGVMSPGLRLDPAMRGKVGIGLSAARMTLEGCSATAGRQCGEGEPGAPQRMESGPPIGGAFMPSRRIRQGLPGGALVREGAARVG